MATPQKENGYTAVANELLDALVHFRIPGEVRQVFDAIMRKTYGFNKKEDHIANSQIVAITGMKKGNVSRALSKLITNKLVIKTDNSGEKGNILKINKDYSQWIPFVIKVATLKKPKKKLSKRITKVIKSDNKTLSEVMDTKDNNHLKDKGEEIGQARLVRDMIEAFTLINPACKRMYGNTSQRQACMDLIDAYTFERTMFIIEKTLPKTNGMTFFPTITTPYQLFQEWAKLEAAVMKAKNRTDINNKARGLA